MGNTTGTPAVPMNPTAWSLVSMWSSIWDAPRFHGPGRVHDPVLSREALAPLLKIAASCVSSLLPHVSATAQLPPHGASRDLLVAAVNGNPHGAALAYASKDPAKFVRILAQAAFRTGDGDYAEGLHEKQLDKLIDQHCASQLEQAACLVRDPSTTLRSALIASSQSIEKVISKGVKEGDLAAVADRLLLAQRLARLADDAEALLNKSQDAETAYDSSPYKPYFEAESTMLQEAQDNEQEEDGQRLPRSQTIVSPNVPQLGEQEDEDADDKSGPPPKRTKSQVAMSLKVQKVKKDVDEHHDHVIDLRRTASLLSRKDVPDGELAALQAELEAVQTAQKRARNFGEDLVEDMLVLDNLSNLADEDRSTRKAAIAGIESLLEDVDAAKTRLATLHKSLEAKVAKAQKEAEKKKAVKATIAPSGASRKQQTDEARSGNTAAVQPPSKDVWKKLRLPLPFHSTQTRDGYVLMATVPGLHVEDLRLELSEDSSTLTISGVKVPTPTEAALMQRKISMRLQQIEGQNAKHLSHLENNMDQAVEHAFIELGQGEFGRFTEAFQIPQDVNPELIDASYSEGVLRVVLPRYEKPLLAHDYRGPGGRYLGRRGSVGAGGYPDLPGNARSAPWGGQLFGGHDDYYRW